MASIRKLPSGRYNAQVRSKVGGKVSKTFDTQQEAEAWAVRLEEKGRGLKGIETESSSLAFADLADSYLLSLANPNTRSITEYRTRRLKQAFPLLAHEINKHHVNAYRLARLKEVAPPTVREELQLIGRVYNWAFRELLLDKEKVASPLSGVSIPPPSKPRSRVISKAELQLLLSALSPTMKTIVELAYETAMRRSEIVKLTREDLFLEERTLAVVDGKTGDRFVPLTLRAVELLREALEERPVSTAEVFSVTPHSVSTALRRARKRVGLDEDVRLHQLRHTRITNVARKGLNQAQIMVVSGHRDVRSVMRYTHLNAYDVVELLD